MVVDIQNMRSVLQSQYRGAPKWVEKVKKMSDKQVTAIYFRMLREGKLAQ